MAGELVPAYPGEFLIYQTEDGRTRVQVRVEQETVWLSLNQLAELFQRDKSVISRHIATICREGELPRTAVVAEFATTATDGKVYGVDHYNLDWRQRTETEPERRSVSEPPRVAVVWLSS